MSRSPLRHTLEYAGLRSAEGLVRALPEPAAGRLGLALGSLAHGPFGVRLGTVEANLRIAFPAADVGWIRDMARAAYQHLGREAVATLKLSRLSPAELRDRVTLEGWEELRAALGEGVGAVLATGHFGNWEIGAAAVAAHGLPMDAVVRRQTNPRADAFIDGVRARFGVRTIPTATAARSVTRALRAGRVVGIVGDQDARETGLWVRFFGRPASTHRGAAFFALRLGAPLFAATCRRLPGRPARYHIRLERLRSARSGDMEADTTALLQAFTDRLEANVKTDPEQYFWFHRRWKTAR